jgi:hypothetical protein
MSVPDTRTLNGLAPSALRRNPSRGGRTATVSPPAIAGSFSGQATDAGQSRMSPIDFPLCLFTSPGPTSPPASLPRRGRAQM